MHLELTELKVRKFMFSLSSCIPLHFLHVLEAEGNLGFGGFGATLL